MIKLRIINESKLKKVRPKKRMTAKERDELFFDKEGRQLAAGIMEEDGELTEENPYRDENGYYSSKKNATCKSTYFKDGKRKSVKSKLTDPDDTGRGRNKSGSPAGRRLCKNNQLKFELKDDDNWILSGVETSEMLQDVIVPDSTYKCAKEIRNNQKIIEKLKNAVRKAMKSKQRTCPLSVRDAANIINSLEMASKGKLNAAADA